tara:strand:+ start:1252 stop:1998 length:747 start_codon:yes stop_codon:yes gene_type:complete
MVSIFISLALLPYSSMAKQKLRCATNDFPPFGFEKEVEGKNTPVGVEVEIFNLICKELNLTCSLELLPWKRMINQVKRGEIDCMFAAFKTEKRKNFMVYTSVPFHVSNLTFFIEKSNTSFKFSNLKDLKGKNICLVRGFTTTPEFDKLAKQKVFEITHLDDFDQCFKMLRKGKVDTTLVNQEVGFDILKKLNINNIKPFKNPLYSKPAYLTFTKKKEFGQIPSQFGQKIFQILKSGQYKKIYDKYLNR